MNPQLEALIRAFDAALQATGEESAPEKARYHSLLHQDRNATGFP